VAPKTGAKAPMSDVAHITDLTRAAAEQLVRSEERRLGSRMTAYEIVAERAGLKADWLRKFIGRSPRAVLGLPAFVKIHDMYGRLCSRVEQAEATERARIVALKGEIDAATPGHMAMVLGLAGQGSSAARARQDNSQEG
jgi:hypothetical protein